MYYVYIQFICLFSYCNHSSVVLQDIIEDGEIKLDWFFKASMINDLVNVSVHNLFCRSKSSQSHCNIIKTDSCLP